MSEKDHIFFWYSCAFFAIGLTRKGDFRIPDREGKLHYFTKGVHKNTKYFTTKNVYLRFGRL